MRRGYRLVRGLALWLASGLASGLSAMSDGGGAVVGMTWADGSPLTWGDGTVVDWSNP